MEKNLVFERDAKYRAARVEAISILDTIDLPYHNKAHALDVELTAVTLAKGEGVQGKNLLLVSLAGIFHDTGHKVRAEKNEPEGAKFAESAMLRAGYAQHEIKLVRDMIIYGTTLPQEPRSVFEKILADADVANLGREDFFRQGDLLKTEFGIGDTLKWLKSSLAFIKGHSFFTETAKGMYELKQQDNVSELERRIAVLESGMRLS